MILATTTDKLQLVTSAAVAVDVHASVMKLASGAVTPDKQNTAISTATTTDIVSVPSSGEVKRIILLTVRNKGASAVDVTVLFDQSGTDFELHKATLRAGEMLQYIEGYGFFTLAAIYALKNQSTSAQGAGFSSDTYLTGSNVTFPVAPVVGTMYRLIFDVTKTGAGTATPIIIVRTGTNGSISATARLTFTFGAGTAVADTAVVVVEALFRTVGSGTSAVLTGRSLAGCLPSTGWSSTIKALSVQSSGFDSTTAGLIIGASYNGGASAAHTVQLCRAEIIG